MIGFEWIWRAVTKQTKVPVAPLFSLSVLVDQLYHPNKNPIRVSGVFGSMYKVMEVGTNHILCMWKQSLGG